MNKVILTIALLFGICFTCYCQLSLVGNWHRVIPEIKNQDLKTKRLRPGDLQIFSDSTFHIQGDTTSKQSNISGWHTAEDYKGKIETRGNDTFTLWIDPKSKMALRYRIIELTKEKLVVKVANVRRNMIYVRF